MDEFVNENFTNSQFYCDAGAEYVQPRFVAVSEFVNGLVFKFEQLTVIDESGIRQLMTKMHRQNYKSAQSDLSKNDRQWVLRQFEIKLLGDDFAFRIACMDSGGQKEIVTGNVAAVSLDNQLKDIFSRFSAMGIEFKDGDIWEIKSLAYCIAGHFALSNLWLQQGKNRSDILEFVPDYGNLQRGPNQATNFGKYY